MPKDTRDENRKYHSYDDKPARYSNGNKYWLYHGELHREDGPAEEYANGDKFWFYHGEYHRIDGPAIEWAGGTKCWWYHGLRHRVDGPAIELANGDKCWYYHGAEAIETDQEIRVSQSILIEGKNYLIYKHVGDQVYLAIIGNQKVYIRRMV